MSDAAFFSEFYEYVASRMDLKSGCPWLRQQSIESLLQHSEGELNELKQAVAEGQPDNVLDEVGDMLYHAMIYIAWLQRDHHISPEQVVGHVMRKIQSRTLESAESAEEALRYWTQKKQEERMK